MEQIIAQINALAASFAVDAEKQLKGNNAAGTRARKATLEIAKLSKEFRKLSIEYKAK